MVTLFNYFTGEGSCAESQRSFGRRSRSRKSRHSKHEAAMGIREPSDVGGSDMSSPRSRSKSADSLSSEDSCLAPISEIKISKRKKKGRSSRRKKDKEVRQECESVSPVMQMMDKSDVNFIVESLKDHDQELVNKIKSKWNAKRRREQPDDRSVANMTLFTVDTMAVERNHESCKYGGLQEVATGVLADMGKNAVQYRKDMDNYLTETIRDPFKQAAELQEKMENMGVPVTKAFELGKTVSVGIKKTVSVGIESYAKTENSGYMMDFMGLADIQNTVGKVMTSAINPFKWRALQEDVIVVKRNDFVQELD